VGAAPSPRRSNEYDHKGWGVVLYPSQKFGVQLLTEAMLVVSGKKRFRFVDTMMRLHTVQCLLEWRRAFARGDSSRVVALWR